MAHWTPQPRWLRWHPVRLLYLFVGTLVLGVLYSEVQALLADPAAALDPTQLRTTFFWHLACAYPVPFAAASVLAVGGRCPRLAARPPLRGAASSRAPSSVPHRPREREHSPSGHRRTKQM
jgi:hypothetical protein